MAINPRVILAELEFCRKFSRILAFDIKEPSACSRDQSNEN
eukprot:Gb_40538 [translate_table: standard]